VLDLYNVGKSALRLFIKGAKDFIKDSFLPVNGFHWAIDERISEEKKSAEPHLQR